MKALLSKTPGGTGQLVLEDIGAPTAGPGEVVISVKAVGVNFPDTLLIEDLYQLKPERPFSPGGEVSGVIKDVGRDVRNLKVGQHVVSACGWGGMREELAIDARRCIPIASDIPFEQAAGLMNTYGTSHYALARRADTKSGETLLVLGAAGGVGLAAVEIGKAMGLNVIAACSTQEKVDLCLSKGADVGLVYDRGPLDRDQQKAFSTGIKKASGGGVDIIYDAVGGDYAEPAVRAMNWAGRYLVIGFAAGIPKLPLNLMLLKSCEIRGVFWTAPVSSDPTAIESDLIEVLALYQAGKIKPHISEIFPLECGGEAIQRLIDRKAQGKVVVRL
ncbi:MAG: NADPH:quinone oxidoreductase family protein [Pseudomonadota bacterium]